MNCLKILNHLTSGLINFLNQDKVKRHFKITRWSFMTLVKRNYVSKIQGICT